METNARHVLVGSFVLLAIALMVAVALWLGKSNIDRDLHYYEVVFSDEVSGLTPGSPVEYSGITVGDVQNLRLDDKDPRVVRVRIRVNADTPVREDTGARLGLANITGSALIRLYGGTPESPRLTGSAENPAVIHAEQSGLNRLLANSESLLGDINNLVQNVNAMFSDDNSQRVAGILDNVEQMTAMLTEQRDELGETLAEIRVSINAFGALATQSARLLEEEGNASLQSLQRAMDSIAQSSTEIQHLLQDNDEALQRTLQGMQQTGPAIEDVSRTMRSLQRLIREIEQNPQGFLLQRQRVEEVNP
ncbi:MlaD family protein [Aliidiomarina soli]|uniref:MCE family protein n=1 Tax=Aliidiomarina soli TaxID=1928574 RepID=A0A432WM53_9GAMM|nr:MlaD family protein [Aliidiomarina soli]RUO34902.1 MCE family protein [Aliidiomarina soli]